MSSDTHGRTKESRTPSTASLSSKYEAFSIFLYVVWPLKIRIILCEGVAESVRASSVKRRSWVRFPLSIRFLHVILLTVRSSVPYDNQLQKKKQEVVNTLIYISISLSHYHSYFSSFYSDTSHSE